MAACSIGPHCMLTRLESKASSCIVHSRTGLLLSTKTHLTSVTSAPRRQTCSSFRSLASLSSLVCPDIRLTNACRPSRVTSLIFWYVYASWLWKVLSLTNIQDCLHTVRALKVLKLLVHMTSLHYPDIDELRSRRNSEQDWRQRLAKSTADKILSELADSCPELTESDSDLNSDDGKMMPEYKDATYAFIRSKQTDPYGNTSTVGMAVETPMVKHYEPCSDILDLMGVFPSDH